MFRLLKALPLTLALAALSIFATSCGSSSSAQARFVNAIQNTVVYGNGLDVEVNGTKKFTGVTFPNPPASTYTSVAPGSDTLLGLQTATTTQAFTAPPNSTRRKQSPLLPPAFATA